MKTLTWDVDDVLNDLTREWFQRGWLPQHPGCKMSYDDLVENPPHRLLSVPQETYLDSLDAFRKAHGSALQPDATTLAWFTQHGGRFRHRALTAMPLHLAEISAGWVMRHFGNWIRSFNIVPSPRAQTPCVDYGRSKAEFLQWLGPSDMVIDDNPSILAEVSQRGIPVLLWPRPWNGHSSNAAQVLGILTALQ